MPKAKAPAKRKYLPFDYDAITADVDCRANPHLYRIGASTSLDRSDAHAGKPGSEQGVLRVEPYKVCERLTRGL